MPILLDDIRVAAQAIFGAIELTPDQAHRMGWYTAFLCHSHDDSGLAKGMAVILHRSGWQVYIDWVDLSMPETPSGETATRIKQKIEDVDYFLFLATPNSTNSRWCPWEIGYADGKKPNENILIIPTTERSGEWYGNEYLQLYRKIDTASNGELGVW